MSNPHDFLLHPFQITIHNYIAIFIQCYIMFAIAITMSSKQETNVTKKSLLCGPIIIMQEATRFVCSFLAFVYNPI
jgi:hypothetical protein